MKSRVCGFFLSNSIVFSHTYQGAPYKKGNYYYKYSPNSEKLLKVIDSRRSDLTEELYAIPDQLLYKRKGTYLGCRVLNYKKMDTISDCLESRYDIDYLKFFKNLTTVINELEKIGISYYDVHDENFLVDKDNNFKAIDLDGAVLMTDRFRYHTRNNLMHLVAEVFFYSGFPDIAAPLTRLLERPITREVLPKDIYDYLIFLNKGHIDQLDRDCYEVIEELEKAVPLILWKK